jgi:hypothetical protein
MDSRLAKLIADYQSRVSDAVAMLSEAGIPRPASNTEWAANGAPEQGSLANGFAYRKHGFGCAVDGPHWGVNFDFGDNGEVDGFDVWRLREFARTRLSEYGFECDKGIDVAVRRAVEAGELRYSGYVLYYLTSTTKRLVNRRLVSV